MEELEIVLDINTLSSRVWSTTMFKVVLVVVIDIVIIVVII